MSTILQKLITDRTQADVKEWLNLRAKGLSAMTDAEKAKWKVDEEEFDVFFLIILR